MNKIKTTNRPNQREQITKTPAAVQVVTHRVYVAAERERDSPYSIIPVTDFGFSRAFQKHYQESNPLAAVFQDSSRPIDYSNGVATATIFFLFVSKTKSACDIDDVNPIRTQ